MGHCKMAGLVLQRTLLCVTGRLPGAQSVRHGSKAVTRHRKAMHFERQKLMALTRYIAPKPAVPERCIVPRKKPFENEIIRRILPSSPYRNLLPLFIGQTLLVVSQEVKAKEMLSVVRSIPHVQLLGACIENTLLSKQGVINCSKLPSIALLQGEVVGGLTLMTSQTCALIQRDSMELVCLLQQYIKQQSDPPMGTSDEGQTETPPSQGTN